MINTKTADRAVAELKAELALASLRQKVLQMNKELMAAAMARKAGEKRAAELQTAKASPFTLEAAELLGVSKESLIAELEAMADR